MKELYKETFSCVRSSYEFNMEDFERMKTKKPARNIILIAAAVAILAAFGITASATGFFGLARFADPASGTISAQGYADSPETLAYMEAENTGITLEDAAQKYGLTYVDRCEIYSYDQMKALHGGDITDMRSSRSSFIVYENGAYSTDAEFTLGGKTVGYQLHRSVKGSLTQNGIYTWFLGENYKEWNIKVGAYDVCLVLGSGSRSFILADLGNGFLTVNVLAGEKADDALSTAPVTEDDLEALAKSLNWSLLSKIVVPELPEKQETVIGAGVELKAENIVEDQSFLVELPGWGQVHFITYKPTEEFDAARFFLSRDGKTSVYEFHAVFADHWVDTAAVCFADLNGDGETDVLILNDYKNDNTGKAERQVRIYSYQGNGEFKWEEELSDTVRWAIDNEKLTVDAVLDFLQIGGGTPQGGGKYDCYKSLISHPSTQSYALFDLDGDGTMELIVNNDSKFRFWAAVNGQEAYLGELNAVKASLHVDAQGKLTLFYSNMSYATVSEVLFDGAAIDTREIAAWEWREGVETPDIGQELTFYAPSDLAPLGEAK